MPAFTAIAIDRFLEPTSRNSTIPKPSPPNFQQPFASPALYATPAVSPLPDYPSSFPPSPYIVNHKRRGPRLQKTPASPLEAQTEVDCIGEAKKADLDDCLGIEDTNCGNGIAVGTGDELMFHLLDSKNSASNLENQDGRSVEIQLRNLGAEAGEFYDAYDELSSDSGLRSPSTNFGDEIRETRLNLLIEIEKRKQVEDTVENLQIKWKNLRHHLSTIGLVLPDLPELTENQAIADPAEDLNQQIVISREVAASIARGRARAAIEMETEPQITAKNFEIARLLDRLRYYEANIREMSQRNQEAVEMARQQRRHRRNRRKKWFYGTVTVAVALGSASAAWSYLPSSDISIDNEK